MKPRLILIAFLLLSVIAFSNTTQGKKYEWMVEEDDEFIWIANAVDEEGMEDIWGDDWDDPDFWEDFQTGYRTRIEIDGDDDRVDFWGFDRIFLELSIWYWGDYQGAKFSSEDGDEDDFPNEALEDPTDYEDHPSFGDDLDFAFLLFYPENPELYWDDIDFHKDVTIEGREVEQEIDKGDEHPFFGEDGNPAKAEEDCIVQASYNEMGVLTNAKLLDEDDQLIAEISLEMAIPGYELPVLIGVTASNTIGIIYIIQKRK